jgi:uncharacterized protein
MAHMDVEADVTLDSPTLVEGLPGVGLVGKIATDHLISSLGMSHIGACYCDGLPDVAVYSDGERKFTPPVRLYADETRELLALQSDIPVSPDAAPEFSTCLVGWFEQHDITPVCLSGLPEEKDGVPELYGIGTGETAGELDAIDVDTPPEGGLISGPTGALLAEAERHDLDAAAFVVQAHAKFPDPEAARILLLEGVAPLTGIDVETQHLVERAEEISDARQQLAQQMQEAEEESTQAQPLGMYQ